MDRKPYAEHKKVAPVSGVGPCSERLPLALAPSPDPERPTEETMKHFGAERSIGLEKNVSVLPGEGSEGAMLRIPYPKGSVNFGSAEKGRPLGGAAFYVPFTTGDTACLHYKVRFPADFEFRKGGKLPGLYGGKAPSGGEKVTGRNGWSVRLMWRKKGEGELYEYIFNKKGKYGLSVGRGDFTFPRGRWVEIELEVRVNEPDRRNGIVRLWIDGKPVMEQDDVVFVTDRKRGTEVGLMFSTFFGGSDKSWASPRDQYADFADFRMYGEPMQ